MPRQYYSVRAGRNPMKTGFDLDAMRKLFCEVFIYFKDESYFQQFLGYDCVDAGFVAGKLGRSVEGALLLGLRKDELAPIRQRIASYDEDDLFDVIEFLFAHCSKPLERHYHRFDNCGWHTDPTTDTFDREAGKAEYREKLAPLLEAYGKGYELSPAGEVLLIADPGFATLLDAPLPAPDRDNMTARVEAAQKKFRRHRSTETERRDAIRDLADVLEFLHLQIDGILTNKDDATLFNIANKFAIRHHNMK